MTRGSTPAPIREVPGPSRPSPAITIAASITLPVAVARADRASGLVSTGNGTTYQRSRSGSHAHAPRGMRTSAVVVWRECAMHTCAFSLYNINTMMILTLIK